MATSNHAGHRIQVDVANLSDAGAELLRTVVSLLTDEAFEKAREGVLNGEMAIVMDAGEVAWEERNS